MGDLPPQNWEIVSVLNKNKSIKFFALNLEQLLSFPEEKNDPRIPTPPIPYDDLVSLAF